MKTSDISKERKVIVWILVVLLVGFVYVMRPFLIPMALAAIVVTVFFPLYKKLCLKLGDRHWLGSLITTLLIFFIIILPVGIVATILINQLYNYVGTLNLSETFGKLFSTDFYVTYIKPKFSDIEARYQITINFFDILTEFGKKVAGYLYSYSPSMLMGTATFIFDFFLMMVGTYFLFIEGPVLLRVIFDISPIREHYEWRLVKHLRNTIDATIYGYLVTGLVQAVLAGILFVAVGLDSFVILGTLTFFMSMVPLVGATGVWLPVAIWLFLQGYTWQGVVVVLGGALVISAIDNFIKPMIIKGRANIHALLAFFSIFGGITLFGPLGILFGPMITALLIATINIYREEYVS